MNRAERDRARALVIAGALRKHPEAAMRRLSMTMLQMIAFGAVMGFALGWVVFG